MNYTLETIELSGQCVPLGKNNAVRLMIQKSNAERYPSLYRQSLLGRLLLRLCNALCRA